MILLQRLSAYFNIQKNEVRSFRLLFLQSLLVGTSLAFYFVVVNSFLIQKASVYNLPNAYLISGIVGFFLVKLYQKLQQKAGIVGSYYIAIISFIALTVINYFLFVAFSEHDKYAVYLAYWAYLFNMPFTIIFALCFYSICARVFNIAQSKRLLALVSTGEVFASIIAYLLSPVIIYITGSLNSLLIISAIAIALVMLPLKAMQQAFADKFEKVTASVQTKRQKINIAFFKQQQFYMLIAAGTLFSVLAVYFVDYSYLLSVRVMATESGLTIAAIVAVFFSVVKAGELIFSLLSGNIISARGIKFSLVLLPLILTAAALITFIAGLPVINNSFFVIGFIFLAKWSERVIRKTITTPATKVLYQASAPEERLQMEANIEGLLNQVTTVIAGLLLIVLSSVFGAGKDQLHFLSIISFVCFLLFAAWSFINVKLYNSYKEKIQSFLHSFRGEKSVQNLQQNKQKEFNQSSDEMLPQSLIEAVDHYFSGVQKQKDNLEGVIHYNHQLLTSSVNDKVLLQRKLASLYYSNENFFSRRSIITYLSNSSVPIQVKTFSELWDVSDIVLKEALVIAFNKNGEAVKNTDEFLFESLCIDILNEIVWVQASKADLENGDNSKMIYLLSKLENRLKNILFGLLKNLYEPGSIDIIQDVIEHGDSNTESKLFALELLENTLNEHLKEVFIPVFDPVELNLKRTKLQKHFTITSLSETERLKDILLKRFGFIDAFTKETALNAYLHKTGDAQILNAFMQSKHSNLKYAAQVFYGKEEELLLQYEDASRLIRSIRTFYNIEAIRMTYVINYALMIKSQKKSKTQPVYLPDSYINVTSGNSIIIIDAKAIADLLKM